MKFYRIGSFIYRDKNTGVWSVMILFENGKWRRTFIKFFPVENGQALAREWSDRHALDMPNDADRFYERFIY